MNSPFRTGRGMGKHWLRKLLDCPCVTVIDAEPLSARIEVAGVSAQACFTEAGLCIGLRLDVEAAPPEPWVAETTLSLAASPFSYDDALALEGSIWMLWHRYEHGIDAVRLEERLAVQLALARRLGESARAPDGGPGSDIGKLI